MFDFLKRKKTASENVSAAAEEKTPSRGFFSTLKNGLAKTRSNLAGGLANLFLKHKSLDQELLNEIENILLSADVGIATTEKIIKNLNSQIAAIKTADTEHVFKILKNELYKILQDCEVPLVISAEQKPFVILTIGVNGSGKTTTIGKICNYYQQANLSIMLAAGDTFRAAAIEQLQIWGERNQVPVVAQQTGADSAAVVFDALESAKAKNIDLLIADTAGRLHTQTNLMTELQKVKRVLGKIDTSAPHEVLLVLDATIGQNALQQVKQFHQAIGITGLVITKLDGTAKGGIIFAIAQVTKLPIRFIGVGESIEDLRPFKAEEFVAALFENYS